MSNIYKLPKKYKAHASAIKFLKSVDPEAITQIVIWENPGISKKLAEALAYACIYNTHLELCFEEYNTESMKLSQHKHKSGFLVYTNEKKTLH